MLDSDLNEDPPKGKRGEYKVTLLVRIEVDVVGDNEDDAVAEADEIVRRVVSKGIIASDRKDWDAIHRDYEVDLDELEFSERFPD